MVVFGCFTLANARELTNFNQFLIILAKLESSNDPKAYKESEKAIGLYQIRPDYFADAQEFNKDLIKYRHSDCYNPEIAKKVVQSYILRYSNSKIDSFETWAKMHNGGGRYWLVKKKNYQKNLDIYWGKFQNINNER